MFKPRRQRQHPQPPNPISDMEQFYLNQYFQSQSNGYIPNPPPVHPYTNQTNDRVLPMTLTNTNQLEVRIARIEQYLGLTTAESSTESVIR